MVTQLKKILPTKTVAGSTIYFVANLRTSGGQVALVITEIRSGLSSF